MNVHYTNGFWRIVGLQIILVVGLSAFFLLYRVGFALGVLCGGMAMVLGNIIVSACFFHHYRQSSAINTLIKFIIGKFGQFLVLILLFLLYATKVKLPLLAFIVGVVLSQMVYWVAPFFMTNKSKVKEYG